MRCFPQRAAGPVALAHFLALIRIGGEQVLRGGPRAAYQQSYRADGFFTRIGPISAARQPRLTFSPPLTGPLRERKDRSQCLHVPTTSATAWPARRAPAARY